MAPAHVTPSPQCAIRARGWGPARARMGSIKTCRYRLLQDKTRCWRGTTAVLAIAGLALVTAAAIRRPPPDFGGRPVWQIRLARAAHEMAVQTLRAQPLPKDRAFELWLLPAGRARPRPLGILPAHGNTVIPIAPREAALLVKRGALPVTLEPSEGAPGLRPDGPPLFRGRLHAAD